jgi:hypothetical protein
MLMGVCSAGFSTTQLPAASAGASFHDAMRIGKFHGILRHDAERLVKMIGDGVVIDLRQRTFLRPEARREIAEMVGSERNVGGARLADRLAVVDGLDRGQQLQILVDPVGDLIEDCGALGGRRGGPFVLGRVRGIERKLDIGGLRAGDLADWASGDWADIVEIPALRGGHPLATDIVVVSGPERDASLKGFNDLVQHGRLPRMPAFMVGP